MFQKMLRVKEEELSLRERRQNSHHRRRRYSDDYDSEAELYQQYKAAGGMDNMVGRELSSPSLFSLGANVWEATTQWYGEYNLAVSLTMLVPSSGCTVVDERRRRRAALQSGHEEEGREGEARQEERKEV